MRIVLDYGGTVVEHVDESEYSRRLGDGSGVPSGGYIAYKAFSLGVLDSEEEYIATLSALTGASPQECRDYLADRKHAADLPERREETLRDLARDHSLVLLTDQVRPWVEEALAEHGLADCFDDLVVSSETGAEKPHPRGYVEALDGADPADAVMVSDEVNADLLMADYLGLTTVWVENDREEPYGEPDARIDDLVELPDAMASLGSSGAD